MSQIIRLRYEDTLGLNRKTITQTVYSGETQLGLIEWYNHWRKYCFFPMQGTLFDSSCLGEIKQHLEQMMQQRKENNEPNN